MRAHPIAGSETGHPDAWTVRKTSCFVGPNTTSGFNCFETWPAVATGGAQSIGPDGFRATSGSNANGSIGQSTGQSNAATDAPWRARALWLQAQTNGDPAAELYKSSIPLGRAAGMGGLGPDSSAYQDSYGKDAAALAKSTAKEAVARTAQVTGPSSAMLSIILNMHQETWQSLEVLTPGS